MSIINTLFLEYYTPKRSKNNNQPSLRYILENNDWLNYIVYHYLHSIYQDFFISLTTWLNFTSLYLKMQVPFLYFKLLIREIIRWMYYICSCTSAAVPLVSNSSLPKMKKKKIGHFTITKKQLVFLQFHTNSGTCVSLSRSNLLFFSCINLPDDRLYKTI